MNAKGIVVRWSPVKRSYVAKFKGPNGAWKQKCVPVNITDQPEAQAFFDDWFAKQQSSVVPVLNEDVVQRAKTVRELLPWWVEWRKGLPGAVVPDIERAESTIKRYVLSHPLGDTDLEKTLALVGRCVDWIEHVQVKPGRAIRRLAPFTVRNIVAVVRTFVSDCRGKGWVDLPQNPFVDPFVKGKLKGAETVAGKETIISLSLEEGTKLITCESDGIPTFRKVNNLLALATGLRAAELQGLAWSHVVDLDGKMPFVDVQRQLSRHGVVGVAQFKPPKKRSYRQVPLHPLAADVLRWWWQHGWHAWTGRAPTVADPVFPNLHGEFVRHHGAGLFRIDLVLAGLPTKFEGASSAPGAPALHPFTFHALRRTFLTMLTDADVPDARIAYLAGHGAKGVTAKHYIKKNLPTFHTEIMKLPLPQEVGWAR